MLKIRIISLIFACFAFFLTTTKIRNFELFGDNSGMEGACSISKKAIFLTVDFLDLLCYI